MTNKPGDIKDVIHFYLGAGIVPNNPIVGTESKYFWLRSIGEKPYLATVTDQLHAKYFLGYDEFKLLLRPLDTIREDESIEIFDLLDWKRKDEKDLQSLFEAITGTHDELVPELQLTSGDYYLITAYLLKNQFDLWGLLESNQAIDKTKVK